MQVGPGWQKVDKGDHFNSLFTMTFNALIRAEPFLLWHLRNLRMHQSVIIRYDIYNI